jgi:Regulator of chromosome condensation (RCC1) repeat
VAAQSGVTAIAAGGRHTVALKSNGSVVAWGNNGDGQTTVPLAAQSGVTAIAAGERHTVALKSNGSVLAWGYNGYGQTTVPVAAQSGVTAIAAGGGHTVALLGTAPPPSFAGWAASFGLSGASAAANSDPDHDGLANAAECILGGDPTMPSTFGAPSVSFAAGSMLFIFPRTDASETPDVTVTVEASTDLLTWPAVFIIGANTAASSLGVSILENGAAADTITVSLALDSHARLFARLKVTIAP